MLARCGSPWVSTNRAGSTSRDQARWYRSSRSRERVTALDDEAPRVRAERPPPTAPPGRRAGPAGRRPAHGRGRPRRRPHGIRSTPCSSTSRSSTAARWPASSNGPQPNAVPRPPGTPPGRTPPRAARRPHRTGAAGRDDPVEAVLAQAVAVVSAARSRPNGAASGSSGRRRQPQVVGGGEPPASVRRRDPPVVAAEADRCVLDRRRRRGPSRRPSAAPHLVVGEVLGSREHLDEPTSGQRWRCTRVRTGTRGPV